VLRSSSQLLEIAAQRGGQRSRKIAAECTAEIRRCVLWAQTRSTASQQTSCRPGKAFDVGLLKAVHCRAAEPAPAMHQSYFARSSAGIRSASQTGSEIGTVLEAQRPQCRHHPAPTLETSSSHCCPLPQPTARYFSTFVHRVDPQRIADDKAAVTRSHSVAT
jgi:hypothetical protein